MPGAQFSDLQNRLLHRVSGFVNDQGLNAAQLGEFINAALKHVQMQADWPWMVGNVSFSTVSGTSTYAVPADWLRTHSLVASDVGDPLHLRTVGELDEVIYQGRPRIYVIDQEQIYLKPIPDGVYPIQHRYYSVEPLLVAGTDTPKIPVQFDDGIIEYAAFLALRYLRQEDRSKMALEGYQEWLKVTLDNGRRQRDQFRIRVRPGAML